MIYLSLTNIFARKDPRAAIRLLGQDIERSAMGYIYKTKGTCSKLIEVELDGDIVKSVKFTGGCNGNLQGIPRLAEGMTVDEVERRLSGIHCGPRQTSCPDQLAKAVREAYNAQN